MKLHLALAAAAATAVALLACTDAPPPAQSPPPSPPPPSPTAIVAADAPTPTATATIVPIPTPTASVPTLAPTPAPSPFPATATAVPAPTPTSTYARATRDEAPVTSGPIRTAIMPGREHFASDLRIHDIAPGGYNTIPPTSGRHWDAWAACGFYSYPLPDELLVHNLEHGNIIVSYNLTDDAEVDALRRAIASIPLATEFAIVRRYPALPEGMVALATWGVLDRMMGVDARRITRFFEDYPGDTGPEFANGLPCTNGVRAMPATAG